MSFLQSFLELITSPSGALVYHLVTLFAIQLILGVAVGHWQRRRDEASARLLTMGIGFFLARTTLMCIAVLDRIALVSSDVVLPPLERFLDLVTMILTAWAFLPIAGQSRGLSPGRSLRPGTPLLIVAMLMVAGTYAAFATLWPAAQAEGLVYNSYWQESVWEVSTVATLGLALVASLGWRGADWGWLVCLLGLWLTGHGLQLATPTTNANSAEWVRLTNLAALPLLAGLVYRRALAGTWFPMKESEEITLGAVGMLKAVQRLRVPGEVKSALELAASSVARIAGADMVAIGLRVPASSDEVHIVALHPATSVTLASQEPILRLSRYPLLSTALQRQRPERAIAGPEVSGASDLYRCLGFDTPGPLLVQPLTVDKDVLGVLLVGNPHSQRAWRTHDEQILQAVATALAPAIGSEQGREGSLNQEMHEAREEVRRIARRAEQLKASLKRQRQRTEELAAKLRMREEETSQHEESAAALAERHEEVREPDEVADALRTQLFHWQDEAQRLSRAKAELEEQLAEIGQRKSTHRRLGGILVGDSWGDIILASRGVHRLLNRSRADLLGTSLQALFEGPLWRQTVRRLLGENSQFGDVTAVSLSLAERTVHVELARLPENESWPGRLAAVFYLVEESMARISAVSEGQDITSVGAAGGSGE